MPIKPAVSLALELLVFVPWPVTAGETDLVAEGRRLAVSLCAKCHLNKGQGKNRADGHTWFSGGGKSTKAVLAGRRPLVEFRVADDAQPQADHQRNRRSGSFHYVAA
jgi:mono/diheme cytochrome c family protein